VRLALLGWDWASAHLENFSPAWSPSLGRPASWFPPPRTPDRRWNRQSRSAA